MAQKRFALVGTGIGSGYFAAALRGGRVRNVGGKPSHRRECEMPDVSASPAGGCVSQSRISAAMNPLVVLSAVTLAFAAAAPLRAQGAAAAASTASTPFRELDRYTFGYAHPGSHLKDHVYERSRRWFAAGDAARDAINTPEALRTRQEEIRRAVLAGIGGLPSSDTPLNARTTGTVAGDGFMIEKVIFESRPRHYVTANLYLPARREGRTGAVLFLSGHHATAKTAPEYQRVCQMLVRAGLIVLAQDPVGQGERLSYYDIEAKKPLVPANTRDHDTAGAQCRFVGDGIARYFVHDAMRSIDYLLTRPEVDPARIGVTGNSGGGTQTSLVMLLETRIAAAAPTTFIMNRETYQRTGQPQDAEQIWSGFTRHGLDHEDILLAMAPKPISVQAVTSDFFPIEGTRRTVARARRVWELTGRGADLQLVEDAALHSYTAPLARAAATFFARHLLGREVDLEGFTPRPFPEPELHCTKTGQVRAEFADAEFVFDANLERFKQAEQARSSRPAAARKQQGVEWLHRVVFRDREQNPLNPRRIDRTRVVDGHAVDIAFWWSQPHLANLGMLVRPKEARGRRMPVTLAIWDDGTAAMSRHAAWIEAECARGRAVFVVNVSGVGPLRPDPINPGPMHEFYGTFHKLSDDLDWIGDSLVALRTFEVLRSLDVLQEWPELAWDDVTYFGAGRMGVHARLAAALDGRIKGGEWRDGFKFADFVRTRSYDTRDVKSVILPRVLQYFDSDEL